MSKFNIRKPVFLLSDFAKGSPVKKITKEMEEFFSGNVDRKELTQNKIKNLLNHASSTTSYYGDYKSITEITEYPIINKNYISKNYNDFLSKSYNKGELIPSTTSGSYGTPFTFYFTKEKKLRQTAEIIFFNRWANCDIGVKHGNVVVRDDKSKIKLFAQNQVLMNSKFINISWLEEQRKILKKKDIKVLIGYPSVIGAIAEYCLLNSDSPRDFSVENIITISETLHTSTKETIKEAFGANVIGRYATMETGVLAHQCKMEKDYHLNLSSYYIELLEMEEDIPVKEPGKLGRIVVTDLHSYAMPLIRYEIGDLGISSENKCECGLEISSIKSIEGRTVETIYTTEGIRIPPFTISILMREISEDIKGIIQFQFIQKDKNNYVLKLVVMDKFSKVEEDLIEKEFNNILGNEARLEIDYVEEIKPLKSGKRPYIINEYYQYEKSK